MLGNRQLGRICSAPFQRRHYRAVINMARVCEDFSGTLGRYLSENGEYPYDLGLRTPIGRVSVRLYSPHDLLTVNEIFCRVDYPADSGTRVVVDLGSNVGISALYFLTRNPRSRCYLYEPDVRNSERLKRTMGGFERRYTLTEKAVSHKAGIVEFGIEPTGRYGGIGAKTGQTVAVECLEINAVLREVLEREEFIDILKVDTEGVELPTVEAIHPEFLARINRIYVEATPSQAIHPEMFRRRQYGSVCQLTNKNL